MKKSKSLWEFDDVFTIKVHGYKSVFDYYDDCSCSKTINDIQIPVLALNAIDDPFINPSAVTHDNENIILAKTKYGGHLGFLEGTIFPYRTNWTINVIEQYFNHFLESTKK